MSRVSNAAGEAVAAANDADASEAVGRRHGGQGWLLPLVLISVVCVAIYSNSFAAPFVFDGELLVHDSQMIRQVWPWKMAWGHNRPVGFLTFGLNYAVGGHEVWGYHAVNVAIHVAAACVLFGIVRRTLASGRLAARYGDASLGLALAAALIWAAHPLQTESVTYLYQRLESLMALFYLLTLYCFIRGVDSARPNWWYAASVACCALGIATKEVAVTAPLAVLWYDRVFRSESWRQLFARRWKFYLALVSTWFVLATLVIANLEKYAEIGVKKITPWQYALTQPGVIWRYLRLSFWPSDLCLEYGWPLARTARQILPPLVALLAVLAGVVWCMFKRPAWGFLLGCFFLILGPTSSLLPIQDIAFEHRMYLPLASVVVAVLLIAYHAWRWAREKAPVLNELPLRLVPGVAAAMIVVVLGSLTFARNRDYSSDLAIWDDTLAKAPDNSWARASRGRACLLLGRTQEAIADCDLAIKMNPANGIAYSTRGNAEYTLKHYDRAIADFDMAIALLDPDQRPYFNRGVAHFAKGDLAAAIADYRREIEIHPRNNAAHRNLAAALVQLKKFDEAIEASNRALEIQPDDGEAHLSRGDALRGLGHVDRAIAAYSQALRLKPDAAKAYYIRGLLYQEQGRPQEALEDYSAAIDRSLATADLYYRRGTLLAMRGDLQQAIHDMSRVIEMEPKFTGAFINRANARRQLAERDKGRQRKQWELAIADYGEGIALDPKAAEAYFGRGSVRTQMTRYDEAIDDFNRTIELTPSDSRAYLNRAICWFHKKDFERAWVDVESYKKLGGQPPPGFVKALREASR